MLDTFENSKDYVKSFINPVELNGNIIRRLINTGYVENNILKIPNPYGGILKHDTFIGLDSIEEIIFSGEFTEIEDNTFCAMNELKKINFLNSDPKTGEYPVKSCKNFEHIICQNGTIKFTPPTVVPDTLTFNFCTNYGYLFVHDNSDIVIPDNVIEIKDYALEAISRLGDSITIPRNVQSIGLTGCLRCKKIYIDRTEPYPNHYEIFDTSMVDIYYRDAGGEYVLFPKYDDYVYSLAQRFLQLNDRVEATGKSFAEFLAEASRLKHDIYSTLDRLTVKDIKDDVCPICMLPLNENDTNLTDEKLKGVCNLHKDITNGTESTKQDIDKEHQFHKACICDYMNIENTVNIACPICRKQII